MCFKLLLKESFKNQKKQMVICNKITDKNTKVSKSSQQNNSDTVTNEHVKEIT